MVYEDFGSCGFNDESNIERSRGELSVFRMGFSGTSGSVIVKSEY